jgi:hypothetical protein
MPLHSNRSSRQTGRITRCGCAHPGPSFDLALNLKIWQ